MTKRQTNSSALRSLSIGGATYDLFVSLKEAKDEKGFISFPIGGKTHITKVIETCGGGAANTSVGLARLGCAASFAGILGSDQWGESMLRTLKKEGVDTTPATIVEGEMSSFSVILTAKEGDRSILTARGVSEHLHDVTFDEAAIKKANIVYLNHLSETSCVIEDNVAGILRECSAHLTWNPGGCQIEQGMNGPNKHELLKHTSLLLLNKEEALEFTHTATVEEALNKLIEVGVKVVCVTDGKHGVTAAEGSSRYHCPIAEVQVIDTTGAGDAFGTGVTWALATGLSLQISLIAGTLNGASVVGTIGAQAGLLTQTQLLQKLDKTTLTVTTLRS